MKKVLAAGWVVVLVVVVIGGWLWGEKYIDSRSVLIDQDDVAYTSNWEEPGPDEVVRRFFEYVRLSRYLDAIEYYDPTTRLLDFPNTSQNPYVLHDRIRQVFSNFNKGKGGQLKAANIIDVKIHGDTAIVQVELVYSRMTLEREIQLKKVNAQDHTDEEQWGITTSIYRLLGDLMD